MTSTPPSTTEITANYVLHERLDQDVVDWAVQMLLDGFDSDSLRILAGESEPFSYYELRPLFERCLRELKIPLPKDQQDALVHLIPLKLKSYLRGEADYRECIRELKQYYDYTEVTSGMQTLYLLNWAASDLEYEEYSHYWDGATRENIDQIIRTEVEKWLAGNEGIFDSSGDTNPS